MRTEHKFLFVELGVLLSVGSCLSYLLFVPSFTYHFHRVIVNFYGNGSMDFTADATSLVRIMGAVALLSMVTGLSVGTAIGLRPGFTKGRPESLSHGAIRVDVDLLKSGLVRGIATQEGTRFDLTEKGKRFLRDYHVIHGLEKQHVAESEKTP